MFRISTGIKIFFDKICVCLKLIEIFAIESPLLNENVSNNYLLKNNKNEVRKTRQSRQRGRVKVVNLN